MALFFADVGLRDLIDCGLGIAFCASAIVAVISPFGKHWGVFAAAVATTVVAGALFMWRWAKRGVFRGLGEVDGEPAAKEV